MHHTGCYCADPPFGESLFSFFKIREPPLWVISTTDRSVAADRDVRYRSLSVLPKREVRNDQTHRDAVAGELPRAAMSRAARSANAVRDDYTDVESLFVGLAAAHTDDERQRWRCQIITSCMPLADHIAYRFVGRGEPCDDLIQVARLGLVKAVDRYRPEKGEFLGFAVPTIIGDLRRHFRDNTWALHVPRGLKETHRHVRAAVEPLSQRLGRAPTTGEIAAELGLELEQVAESMEAAYAYRPASIDAVAPGGPTCQPPPPWSQRGSEDPRYASVEDRLAAASLIGELTHRERLVLKMRFCDGMTQTQIAQRLDMSQAHVSRLLSGVLDRLRTRALAGPGRCRARPAAG